MEFPEGSSFTPVFTYVSNGLEHKETRKVAMEVNEPKREVGAGGRGENIDYRREALEILSEKMSYATEMGKIIAEKYGITKDQAKLRLKSALEELKNNNEVGRVKYLRDGKPIVMYYSRNPNLSNLHTGMQSQVVGILNDLGVTINRISTTGERNAFDIETDFFMVEIETGLKHSMEDLKGRINSTNLRVIIIVPNKELIDRYQGIGKNVVILTADSLKNLLLVPDKEPHSNF